MPIVQIQAGYFSRSNLFRARAHGFAVPSPLLAKDTGRKKVVVGVRWKKG